MSSFSSSHSIILEYKPLTKTYVSSNNGNSKHSNYRRAKPQLTQEKMTNHPLLWKIRCNCKACNYYPKYSFDFHVDNLEYDNYLTDLSDGDIYL